MGAHLVARVLADWTHVSDRAFRVLVRMALTALDKPNNDQPAHVYFAGRELLAMTLRSDKGTPESRFRVVARVVAELIEAGAIERADAGRTGHNAVYRLTLSRAKTALEDPDQGGQISHPQGGQISHPKGGQISPERVAKSAIPRNQEEPLEELLEERRGLSTTTSHPPRATAGPKTAPVIELFPKATRAAPAPRRAGALDAIAEAAQRRRAAEAAHRNTRTPEVS